MSARAAKIGAVLAALAGLTGVILLIVYQDVAKLGDLLATAGWGIALVILVHIPQLILCALGWRAAASALWPRGWPVFFWARLVRESVSGILPVTLVGGDFVGARFLTFYGARAVVAGASVLVDLTFEFVALVACTAVGLIALLAVDGGSVVTRWTLLGLALAVPAVVAAILVQKWGIFKLVERLLEKLALRLGWPALRSLSDLHETVAALYRNRRGLLVGTVSHFGAWIYGTFEVWLILHLLGKDTGLVPSLIIESLGQAIRSAAFLVPGALGVQEGGFLLLGTLFGLAPEVGLAISLIKRIREVVLGVPTLLVWQAIEARRFLGTTGD